MSKLSKKQEKKRKLRQRERESKNPAALAYYGNKYRTEVLIRPLMDTETAILEAFIVLDREPTDHDVSRALVELIELVRRGNATGGGGELRIAADDPVDAIVQLVRGRWQSMGGSLPGRDNLMGILRTILGSVQNHKTVNPQSRKYLNFLEGFLGELGVQVRAVPASEAPDRIDYDRFCADPKASDTKTIDVDFDVPPEQPK